MTLIDQLIDLLSRTLAGVLILIGLLFPTTTPIQTPDPINGFASTTASFPIAPEEEKVTEQPIPAKSEPKPLTETVAATPKPIPTKTETQVNEEARAALVNIYCSSGQGINGISGSGVLIDSRGIILTNAHIGQYFLLRDYPVPNNVQCVVRTGSPAEPRYTAELMYLPPAWIADNASQITASVAVGTGEHDYAFLYITGRTNSEALPASFPHLAMDRGYPNVGEEMLLASYPAGFLGGETLLKNLYAGSAVAYVTQLFTFSENRNKVDLFSIGGTVVSQGGSSGGAAVRLQDGKLAGLISLATVANSTEKRDLRALSLAHIDESLASQGQGGVVSLLSGDIAAKVAIFNTQIAPVLRQQLLDYLPK